MSTMQIKVTDGATSKGLFDPTTDQNLWIERVREDGTVDYIGSLFFNPQEDGSTVVTFGASDEDGWEERESVTIPANAGESTWDGKVTA